MQTQKDILPLTEEESGKAGFCSWVIHLSRQALAAAKLNKDSDVGNKWKACVTQSNILIHAVDMLFPKYNLGSWSEDSIICRDP